jgi:hypothetical protein
VWHLLDTLKPFGFLLESGQRLHRALGLLITSWVTFGEGRKGFLCAASGESCVVARLGHQVVVDSSGSIFSRSHLEFG